MRSAEDWSIAQQLLAAESKKAKRRARYLQSKKKDNDAALESVLAVALQGEALVCEAERNAVVFSEQAKAAEDWWKEFQAKHLA